MNFPRHPLTFALLPLLFGPANAVVADPLRPASAPVVAKLTTLFQSRDSDGDGSLGPLRVARRRPRAPSSSQLRSIDRNRDGGIL